MIRSTSRGSTLRVIPCCQLTPGPANPSRQGANHDAYLV